MKHLKRLGTTVPSILLSLVAAIYWVMVLMIVHPLLRRHLAAQQHDAVRKLIGRWSRRGYAVFRLWGVRIRTHQSALPLPVDRPVIVVSSHHSSLDMVFLLGLLQDSFAGRNLRFIARPGLDTGIPVVSLYIQRYCYSLSRAGRFRARAEREDRIHMAEFCQRMNTEKGVVTIFPEGIKPRGQAEHSRAFSRTGLSVMLEHMPDAIVLPLVIKGTGEFYSTPRRWKHWLTGFPRFGVTLDFSLLSPLEPRTYADSEALIAHCEALIHREYARLQHIQHTHQQRSGELEEAC